ncbi:acetylornithine deacetylase [Pseudooceanicola antarcticus]|uniref:Acetylornithine deacetylase n=1 Tax=Pseudooceanicola antarcticus TaxID=1247613 RepID=A0A285IYS4_9RHOB|nr:acetylornithine deacetylase [Pseudooceanicola antarcticus]PJE25798.1 acetylornithine deacetylase [Pseudooceanicola antarcticus]SNY52807.1 acetylornithine deacetylase [Pseudooceanicola antarcticus]
MLERSIDILGDLVGFPTISSDSNMDAIGYMAEILRAAGARVEILRDASGQKANLWATIGPEADGGLVLSGHSDVVPVAGQPWSRDPFAMVRQDGRLYGRGTCDMKGFIAACLALAPQMAAAVGDRPFHFAFTHDEEVGCLGGRALAEELSRREVRPAMALIGEPTSMQLVEGHKGCCEYTVRFTGTGGHGSSPELGVNAVEYATRYITRLLELRAELKARAPEGSPFEPPHTTINIGALHGGTIHNVIPAEAQLDWEMRPVNMADQDFVKETIARFVAQDLVPEMQARAEGTGISTEVMGEVCGLLPMPENQVRDMIRGLTGANGVNCVPFNTEAGLFQQIGMDAVICGPGSIAQAHQPDEYLEVDQLAKCLELLDGLIAAHGR